MDIFKLLEDISTNYGKYYEPIFFVLISSLLIWLTTFFEKYHRVQINALKEQINLQKEKYEFAENKYQSPKFLVDSMKSYEEYGKMMKEQSKSEIKKLDDTMKILEKSLSKSNKDNKNLKKQLIELEEQKQKVLPKFNEIEAVVSTVSGSAVIWDNYISSDTFKEIGKIYGFEDTFPSEK
jgi:ElaB/YqjD/DUF883 family membrane-anchored ribosome-binding protein